MAGVKISALPPVPSALLTDIFPVVQAGITSQETVAQLTTLITSTLSGSFVPIAGGTMTGPLILSADATLPLQAVTFEQLQIVAAGFTVILACQAATTANLSATQAGAGIGATLTNNAVMAAFTIDGYAAVLNDRILVKNQTLPQHNGVYTVTTVGSAIANWVLTRATDYDQAPTEVKPGTLIAVNNGTVNATTSWLETATVVTMDTDPILFSQFTFSPTDFLKKLNNLSDLNSVPAALVNLGLGVPVGTGNVVLQTSPTLITPILGVASATSLNFTSTAGIIGTTTNNNANAGSVGEFISSVVASGSSVATVSIIATNVTTIALSAGDWDVWGNITSTITGSCTSVNGWTSTTSATVPDKSLFTATVSAANLGSGVGVSVPRVRYSLAAPTTIYLSTITVFTTGSVTICGGLYARRVR